MTPPPAADRPATGRTVWAAAAVFALAVAVYSNTLQNGFVMDDGNNVVDNAEIRSLRQVPWLFTHAWTATAKSDHYRHLGQRYWRPLASSSYAVDYQLWRLNAAGYHLTNVLLHGAVSALLLLLLLRLGGSLICAVVGGALFALHPIHSEAVAVISYRTDLLAALFTTLALVVHLGGRGGARPGLRPWRQLLVLPLLYAAGLASKESAVVLPAWLLALDALQGRIGLDRARLRSAATTYLPLLLCVVGYLLLRQALLPREGGIDFFSGYDRLTRALSVAKIYGLYVRLLCFPWPLLAFYDWTALPPASGWGDIEVWIGVIQIAATVFFLVVCWRRPRLRLVGLGLAWWCLGLLPVMHLVPLPVGAAERFLYLPSLGVCVAAAVGGARLFERRRRVAVIGSALAALLMIVAVVTRNGHWHDDITLWRRAVEDFPHCFSAHHNLGRFYARAGRRGAAIRELARADEILPNIATNVRLLAEQLLAAGEAERARKLLERTMRVVGPTRPLVELWRRTRPAGGAS